MEREKLYLNAERYEEEIKKHRGEYHRTERIDGRKARLWVQSDLARIMGITPQHLSGIKSRHEPTSEKALLKLAAAWSVNWKWLCSLSDYRTEEEERKEKILSRFDTGLNRITLEMMYMQQLGITPVPYYHPEPAVNCYYQPSNAQKPKEIKLSLDQFKKIRQAMNKAAAGALLSCLELLDIQENTEEEAANYSEMPEEDEEILMDHLVTTTLFERVLEMREEEDPEEFKENIARLREPYKSLTERFLKHTEEEPPTP